MKARFNKNEVSNFNADTICCMQDELADLVKSLKETHQMNQKDAVTYAKRAVINKFSNK